MDKLKNLSKLELLKAVQKLSTRYGSEEVLKAAGHPKLALSKARTTGQSIGPPTKKARIKKDRPFDMSKFYQRRVALHVMYLGHNYYGLAAQHGETHGPEVITIEDVLFQALRKTCLITSREECQYARCGRTDRGVSAFGQVLSLTLRSKQKRELNPDGSIDQSKTTPTIPLEDELDYPSLLNKVLPDDIMVLGWANVDQINNFSARFSCRSRTYRYAFVRRQLDVEKMRVAAKMLEGKHDFRNLCKMNVKQVRSFERNIQRAEIIESAPRTQSSGEEHKPSPFDLCYVEIQGSAFLWHQIRCIMAILFLIGRGLEEPQIIADFLDLEKTPAKPVYDLASPNPLVLYGSDFSDLEFRYSPEAMHMVTRDLEHQWAEHARRQHILRMMIDDLGTYPISKVNGMEDSPRYQPECDYSHGCLNLLTKPKRYHKLKDRPTCDTYEERVANLSEEAKAKIKEIHNWDL